MSKTRLINNLICIYIAFIFIQSLFFKFSGSSETQHIFTTIGQHFGFIWFANYGVFIVGCAELFASLLLFTQIRIAGSIFAAVMMAGAVYFHLFTPLGTAIPMFDSVGQQITNKNDGGLLFYNAIAIFCFSIYISYYEFKHPNVVTNTILKKSQLKQKAT